MLTYILPPKRQISSAKRISSTEGGFHPASPDFLAAQPHPPGFAGFHLIKEERLYE